MSDRRFDSFIALASDRNLPSGAPRELPESLETERLTLRAPRPEDGPLVNEAVCETLESLRPWMDWAQTAPSLEQSAINARRATIAFQERSELRWHLFLRETETLVGICGLQRIDWRRRHFEIGYWCRLRCQGQGYTTEAVRRLTALAFDTLGAGRVAIRCDRRNDASRRIAEKVGYIYEGERHGEVAPDGTPRVMLIYSLTPGEYGRWSR